MRMDSNSVVNQNVNPLKHKLVPNHNTYQYGTVRSRTEQNGAVQRNASGTLRTRTLVPKRTNLSTTYMVEISIIQLCCIDHSGPYKWSVAHCRRYAVSGRSNGWRYQVDLISAHYTKMKLSTWAIRHGMDRNGYAQGWGVLERF